MKNNMETKEQRLARQKREHNKLIREMKESVMEMYKRKVEKDAFFINYTNIVEEVK